MKGVEDFCLHEHPLIYNDDQQEDWCCSACGLPLLLSPSYRCSHDCDFFLHKACKQLPQELNDVGAPYSLSLDVKPPNKAWTCDVCGELCKNLIAYRSTEWLDKDDELEYMIGIVHVDVLCAPVPLEIKSKHDSHKHELIAMRREALLLCDVCKRPHKGFFFSCNSCGFWIHKDCAVLPRVIETTFHPHLLVFSYSYFGAVVPTTRKNYSTCEICSKNFSATAAYQCWEFVCQIRIGGPTIVHPNCAISKIKENSGYDLPVQFPLEEADKSLFIYKMLDKKRIVEKNNDEDEKSRVEKYHNHPLIFHDIVDKDSSSNSVCDACILPVNSPPYYSCENRECDFLLHQHCTNLPNKINLTGQFTLNLKADELLASLFGCQYCDHHWSNGFGYNSYGSATDLECSSAPRTIKHKLHHMRHILYRISVPVFESPSFACCSGQDYRSAFPYSYKCASCNFRIHSRCAFLPAKVSHKFDKHPLQLSRGTDVNGEYSFCEICEGHVDINYWFYHCEVCDQFFHVKCLPSVGLLSKIKFGGTFVIPRHPEDHPVTLTRMLEIGNQRCSECERVIEGFVDAMAFECSKCCYWFHFRCAFQKGTLDSRKFRYFPFK